MWVFDVQLMFIGPQKKKLKRELGTTWIIVYMMLTTIIDFIFIIVYSMPSWHFNLVSLEWYYYILTIDIINTPVIQRNGDTQLLYRWFVTCLMLQHPFQVLIVYLAQKMVSGQKLLKRLLDYIYIWHKRMS